jgi:hypothetical protein
MKKWYYLLLLVPVLFVAVFFFRGGISNKSLAGIDADNNGFRDDVEKFIDTQYPDEKIRIAARQFHKGIQNAILDPENWDPSEFFKASDCLHYLDPEHASEISGKLEAETANKSDRIRAYWKANATLSGTIVPGIKPRKEACSFGPTPREK